VDPAQTGGGGTREVAMRMKWLTMTGVLAGAACISNVALADQSAELYTTQAYRYGRFEARIRYAAGDGVVSSFFLWKVGSEVSGAFWNELDFEKIGADCHVQTNALYGNPGAVHKGTYSGSDLCTAYHDYRFEWTPDYIAWAVDGQEIRRDTGETATAFAQNATEGMRIHFNVWPGDQSFGGNYDPSILPVYQYISWVQYSSYDDGAFNLAWREDFNGGLPSGWALGDWGSPKNKSTHNPNNVGFVDGIAVLAITTDGATGSPSTVPPDGSGTGGAGTGGTSSGGTSSGGDAAGGDATGGLATGGDSTGGVTTGGTSSGGLATGGDSTGGTADGGVESGGTSSGGTSVGGYATGGATTGGTSSGGLATGGAAPLGGVSGGGTATGGVSTGGVGGGATGGLSAGGTSTGGAASGGVPVGSTSGGGTLGGSATTGGVTPGATGGASQVDPGPDGAMPLGADLEDAGCACRARPRGEREGWGSVLAMLALLLGWRRRSAGRDREPTARRRPAASRGESIAGEAAKPDTD